MNTQTSASPTSTAMLQRGAIKVTAYRAGFEDCVYQHIYGNPFDVGTHDWRAYDRGNEDARRAAELAN